MRVGRLTGALLVAGSGLIFSFGPLIYRAVDDATAWQYLTYRAGSVVIAMLGLLVYRSRHAVGGELRKIDARVVLAGLCLAGMFTFFVLALERTTAATTLFLQATAPFVAALIGWVALKERVRRVTWVAMAIAGLGIAIMVRSDLDAGNRAGAAFAVGIALLMGCYSVLLRSMPAVEPALPAIVGAAIACVIATGFALAETGLGLSLSDATLAVLGGGVTLGIGLPLFNLGHRFVRAAEVPLLLLTEVVLAPVWVWIWAAEEPPTTTLVGGAIVLSAVVVLAVVNGTDQSAPTLEPTLADSPRTA